MPVIGFLNATALPKTWGYPRRFSKRLPIEISPWRGEYSQPRTVSHRVICHSAPSRAPASRVLPRRSLSLRHNVLIAAESIARIVHSFYFAKPGVIATICLRDTPGVILIETVYVHCTSEPGLHGGVESARPVDVARILRRVVPQADQDEVEWVGPGWECGSIRGDTRRRSMRVFQDCESTRGGAAFGELGKPCRSPCRAGPARSLPSSNSGDRRERLRRSSAACPHSASG